MKTKRISPNSRTNSSVEGSTVNPTAASTIPAKSTPVTPIPIPRIFTAASARPNTATAA